MLLSLSSFLVPSCLASSIRLDVSVNALHEHGGACYAHGAAQQKERDAEHPHVAEVEACLEEARHFRLPNEVIHRVQQHVARSTAGRQERNPLPVVVFRVENEVRGYDGSADLSNFVESNLVGKTQGRWQSKSKQLRQKK